MSTQYERLDNELSAKDDQVTTLRARLAEVEAALTTARNQLASWNSNADAARQPAEFYTEYSEGTMRAMQALLATAERERNEAQADNAALRATITPQIAAVVDERRRQNSKWGEQNHDLCTWCTILTEEVGEFAEAALHATDGGANEERDPRKEAIHCAAVAVQIVEYIDRQAARPKP